jgi:outer membrane protein assembly factor BamE (lipoprotein component of BamABCDE complex)
VRVFARYGRAWLGAALLLAAAACSPIVDRHGYAPTDADLEQIVVGIDTQATVADVVGRPTAAGVLQNSGWYYVESEFRTVGPLAKREVSREVVAISFDQAGVVQNIERFGLERGRGVVLSRRVTDSNIEGLSVLQQLLGNIANFDTSRLADGI